MNGAAGRRGAVFWIAAAVTIVILVLVVVSALSRDPTGTLQPSTFSRAATGHAALVALLEKLGRPVTVSRHETLKTSRADGGLLVLAEPSRMAPGSEAWRTLLARLDSRDAVLVVLPKRRSSIRNRRNSEWLDHAPVADQGAAERLLKAALPERDLSVVRRPPGPDAAARGIDVEGSLQLIRGTGLVPLVPIGDDLLLGGVNTSSGAAVYVLSDPDLIANAGIGRGENAALVVRMLDVLRDGHGIVIDETIHGFALEPGLWDLLLRFPYVLVPITLVVFSLVLIAAASSGRIGKLLAPPQPLKEGRKVLIASAADMLAQGHHDRFLLARYARLIRRQISRRLSPRAADRDDTRALLDDTRLTELARRRAAGSDPAALFAAADAGGRREALPAARALFEFKERMIIGDRSARPGTGDRAGAA